MNEDTNPGIPAPEQRATGKTQMITWGALATVIMVGMALLAVVKDGSATLAKIDAKSLENEHRIERIETDNRADGATLSDIRASLARLQSGQDEIKRRLERDGQ